MKKLFLLIGITGIIFISYFIYQSYVKPVTPPELIQLREEIKQSNQGKNFNLDYEYTGPNTHQPLPFNYE